MPCSFEKLHGLSHVNSHGLGHDILKGFPGLSQVKSHGLGHDILLNKTFINFEDICKVIMG